MSAASSASSCRSATHRWCRARWRRRSLHVESPRLRSSSVFARAGSEQAALVAAQRLEVRRVHADEDLALLSCILGGAHDADDYLVARRQLFADDLPDTTSNEPDVLWARGSPEAFDAKERLGDRAGVFLEARLASLLPATLARRIGVFGRLVDDALRGGFSLDHDLVRALSRIDLLALDDRLSHGSHADLGGRRDVGLRRRKRFTGLLDDLRQDDLHATRARAASPRSFASP